jgi:serine/threonine protein kinase
MATVLLQHSLSDIREFFNSSSIALNLDAIPLWIEELGKGADDSDKALLAIISQMLNEDPKKRPSAREVFDEVASIDGHEPFCGACCYPGDFDQPVNPHKSITEESPENMQSLQAILEPSIDVSPETVPKIVNDVHITDGAHGGMDNDSTERPPKHNTRQSSEPCYGAEGDLVMPPSEAPPSYESLIENHASDGQVVYSSAALLQANTQVDPFQTNENRGLQDIVSSTLKHRTISCEKYRAIQMRQILFSMMYYKTYGVTKKWRRMTWEGRNIIMMRPRRQHLLGAWCQISGP